jgi:hypothetical protein
VTPMPDKFFTQVQGYYYSEFSSDPLRYSNSSLKMLSAAGPRGAALCHGQPDGGLEL